MVSDLKKKMLDKSPFVLKAMFARSSFYENKVFQLMSAGASLERFGEETSFS